MTCYTSSIYGRLYTCMWAEIVSLTVNIKMSDVFYFIPM